MPVEKLPELVAAIQAAEREARAAGLIGEPERERAA